MKINNIKIINNRTKKGGIFVKVKIEEKEFGDPGKVMLVLHSAANSDLKISKDQIDSYIYLLCENDILRFTYPFRFQPLPYSPLLHEDIYNLSQASFIGHSCLIHITAQGMDWIDKRLPASPKREEILSEIGGSLKEYVSLSPIQLFQSIYSRATKAVT